VREARDAARLAKAIERETKAMLSVPDAVKAEDLRVAILVEDPAKMRAVNGWSLAVKPAR
jgi:hypothetical protein